MLCVYKKKMNIGQAPKFLVITPLAHLQINTNSSLKNLKQWVKDKLSQVSINAFSEKFYLWSIQFSFISFLDSFTDVHVEKYH